MKEWGGSEGIYTGSIPCPLNASLLPPLASFPCVLVPPIEDTWLERKWTSRQLRPSRIYNTPLLLGPHVDQSMNHERTHLTFKGLLFGMEDIIAFSPFLSSQQRTALGALRYKKRPEISYVCPPKTEKKSLKLWPEINRKFAVFIGIFVSFVISMSDSMTLYIWRESCPEHICMTSFHYGHSATQWNKQVKLMF